MLRPLFINNRIYHVYNRGVDKRRIFSDNKDRLHFIHDLFEFNDTEPASSFQPRILHLNSNIITEEVTEEVGLPQLSSLSLGNRRKPRKLLVEILAFILMPNHYHLLLRQIREGGVTMFMRKLGTGYTNYFNLKYKRSGVLFQGKFKAVAVKREQHFIYLPYYIHLNCLDMVEAGWREGKLKSFPRAMGQLKTYRWSSHLDYTGKKNFPSVTQREWLLQILGGEVQYKKGITRWLKQMNQTSIKELGMTTFLLE